MAEYIERSDALRAICDGCDYEASCDSPCQFAVGVAEMPAADVKPVVTCGECKHYIKRYWDNGRCYGTFCDIWNRDHGKTFFCSDGEKREV